MELLRLHCSFIHCQSRSCKFLGIEEAWVVRRVAMAVPIARAVRKSCTEFLTCTYRSRAAFLNPSKNPIRIAQSFLVHLLLHARLHSNSIYSNSIH